LVAGASRAAADRFAVGICLVQKREHGSRTPSGAACRWGVA
jgi:hypothetical protein